MPAYDYGETARDALEMLEEFGRLVTLQVPTSAYDPDQSQTVTTWTDHAGTGAAFDYKSRDAGTANADGSLILMGDKRLLLTVFKVNGSAMPKPLPGNRAMLGSEAWNVISAQEVNPAGTPVLYIAQLRK